MKAPRARHERREGTQSMICVVCLLGVLISAMSLGSLRLYGLYLEHRLAYVTMKIEAISNKNAIQEERYSSLLSPSRIYTYAKLELKMVTAQEIETIRLNAGPGNAVAVAELTPREIEDLKQAGKWANFFVGTANAQD